MEVIILDNSKAKFKFKVEQNENDLKFFLESAENNTNKKYELNTSFEDLKKSDQDFSIFKNISKLLRGIKISLESNQYSLVFDEEIKSMNLEIKNILFDKGFASIRIPEKGNEKENNIKVNFNTNSLSNFYIHVGDIIKTIRDLSNDDNWLECNGHEIDTKKYPKLTFLLGGEFITSEWEKGGYIGKRNCKDEDGKYSYYDWYSLSKSETYYASLKSYYSQSNDYKNLSYSYYYYLSFSNNKFSNDWSSKSICNFYHIDGEEEIVPSRLFYINNTWIILGHYKKIGKDESSRTCLWYCHGDMPNDFILQKFSSPNFTPRCGIIYGNGYYVICANNYYSNPKYISHPGVIYGKKLNDNNWTHKQTSSDSSSPSSFIFENNTFIFCFSGDNDEYISITYCIGEPTNSWITEKIVPPDGDKKSSPYLAYAAPYWMMFFTCNNRPFVCFTDDLKKKWEIKEAPFYDGHSSYYLDNAKHSKNNVTVIGKRNEHFFTWHGNSPKGEWKEISCEVGFNDIKNIPTLSFFGDELCSIIHSGENYYLGFKKNFSRPCVPLIKPDGDNAKSYIRAK